MVTAMTEMPISCERMIDQRLRSELAADSVDVEDQSHLHVGHAGARSGGGHYAVTVVSSHFQGLNLLARHRLVYQALGQAMQSDIHALSISAYTPEEL